MGQIVQEGLTRAEADTYVEQMKSAMPDAVCTVTQNADGSYDVTVTYKDLGT